MLRISVIVPVYKAEKFIERCVDSILNQTYKNIELILIDDGSPDQSAEICDRYASNNSRVRVIHQKNAGVSVARNVGLDLASGDYIAFVDADDYIEPRMYEKMLEQALEYDCDVVMCDCVKEYEKYSQIYTHNIRAGFYNQDQLVKEYYPHLLMMENFEYPATISNWLLLWKSTLNVPQMRYEPGIRYSEDLLFGAKLMCRAKSFYYMKGEAYYHYVMNPVSASHTYVLDKWNDYKKLYERIKDAFGKYEIFDFSYQIDLCLLFFMFNAIGDIYKMNLSTGDKKAKIKSILMTPTVINMFKHLRVTKLNTSKKQKLLTLIYKYRIGLSILITYYERK